MQIMPNSKVTIFHNPRCSKSREALGYLNEMECEIELVEYLKTGLTSEQLVSLLDYLQLPAHAIMRKSEPIFQSTYAGKELSESDCIHAMVENPILMERPIILYNDKAVIGRPPVLVKSLIAPK
jgi:arsenate reductase